MSALGHRYDIILFFDVTGGNPNGDPASGNAPRADVLTHQGLVSDVSLKRRIRNFTTATKAGVDRYHIYVHDRTGDGPRGRRPNRQADAVQAPPPPVSLDIDTLTRFFCENFFDVRTFGAVIDTTHGTSHVRGPVQVGVATSVEPIETAKASSNSARDVIPYALFRAHFYVNAKLAERTGFDDCDLNHLLEALKGLFDNDVATGRTDMAVRRIIAFRHRSPLGNAPAESLFARVSVARIIDSEMCSLPAGEPVIGPPARQFGDYRILIDRTNLPEQLELLEIL